jgi:membrane associated rhomboid family serine protease
MIPISDHIRLRHRPIVIYWLIGINIAIFLWQLKLGITGELASFINSWGLIPAQISGAITNAIYLNPAAWVVVFWRLPSLFLAMFLHGSISQIVGNLIFLWVFGKTLSSVMGARTVLALYLGGGILTGIAQVILEPSLTVPLIGANGAISTILGAYVSKFPQGKIDTIMPLLILYIPMEVPAYSYLLWWFIQQLFYGIGSLNMTASDVNSANFSFWVQLLGLCIGAAVIRYYESSSKS